MAEAKRQLAAIMFTDIVGYTALMGSDENKAFEVLRKNRNIQKPIIKKYNGRWLKEMGDGILASFDTASDAVRCAGEIQNKAKKEGVGLRIGIHTGEVVFQGSDVLGDGVNVASRLEEMAAEGSIYISGAVYKDIKNKEGISAEFIEEKTLKHVDDPVKVYQVIYEEEIGQEKATIDQHPGKSGTSMPYYLIAGLVVVISGLLFWHNLSKQTVSPLSDKASMKTQISIAVLPFDNLSGDLDQEVMCDGLTEEIIHYLSIINVFDKVISRSSVMTFKDSEKTLPEIARLLDVNYILEGSYRQSGNRLRITAQLIEASKDNHLWTEIYERPTGDIFDIQSDIAKKIATSLKGELSIGENEQLAKKPTDNLEAYNLYLKGRFFWHQRTEEDLKMSIYYFNQALELDTAYALGYAGLADAYFIMAWWGWYPADYAYNKGKEYALKALSIQNIAEVHATLGGIATWHDWNWENAEKEIKLAILLNPNYATAFQYDAELLDILGKNNEARAQINRANKLNPHSYIMNAVSAIFYYHNAEYEKSIEEYRKILEITNDHAGMLTIFKCYIKLGLDDKAIKQLKNIISMATSVDDQKLFDNIYQKSGIEGIVYWFIDWILSNHTKGNFNITSPNYRIASLYAIIGNSQKTIEYLDKGIEMGEGVMPRMNNNQDFNFIKTDPEFISLLKKMRL